MNKVISKQNQTVLCVDLDGTLIRTDTSLVCLFQVLKCKPWHLLWLPFWLWRGKAYFKYRLAKISNLVVAKLPYDQSLLSFLRLEHARGRQLALVTGSDLSIAKKVSDHLGIFEQTLASTPQCNLTGRNKANQLIATYGAKQFDYIGNEFKDLHIWRQSRFALIASATPALISRLEKQIHLQQFFSPLNGLGSYILNSLQKPLIGYGLLLFLPLLLLPFFSLKHFFLSLFIYICFNLISHSIYLFSHFFTQAHHNNTSIPYYPQPQKLILTVILFSIGFFLTIFISPIFTMLTILIGSYFASIQQHLKPGSMTFNLKTTSHRLIFCAFILATAFFGLNIPFNLSFILICLAIIFILCLLHNYIKYNGHALS